MTKNVRCKYLCWCIPEYELHFMATITFWFIVVCYVFRFSVSHKMCEVILAKYWLNCIISWPVNWLTHDKWEVPLLILRFMWKFVFHFACRFMALSGTLKWSKYSFRTSLVDKVFISNFISNISLYIAGLWFSKESIQNTTQSEIIKRLMN